MSAAYKRVWRMEAIFVIYLLSVDQAHPVAAGGHVYHGEALKPRSRSSVDLGKPHTVILARKPLSSGTLKQFHAYRQLKGGDVANRVVDFEIWAQNESNPGVYTLKYQQEVRLPALEGRHNVNVSGSPKVHSNYYVGFSLRSRMAPFANDPGVHGSVALVQSTNGSRIGSTVVARPGTADAAVYSVGATVAQDLPKATAAAARKRPKCIKKPAAKAKTPVTGTATQAPTAVSTFTGANSSSTNVANAVSHVAGDIASAIGSTTTTDSKPHLTVASTTQLEGPSNEIPRGEPSPTAPQPILDQGTSVATALQPSTDSGAAASTTTAQLLVDRSSIATTVQARAFEDNRSTPLGRIRHGVTTQSQATISTSVSNKSELRQKDDNTVATTTHLPLSTNDKITVSHQLPGRNDTVATSSPEFRSGIATTQSSAGSHIETTTNKLERSTISENLRLDVGSSSKATTSGWQNNRTADGYSTAALSTSNYRYNNSTASAAKQQVDDDSHSSLATTRMTPREGAGGENATQKSMHTENHDGTTASSSLAADHRGTTAGTSVSDKNDCFNSELSELNANRMAAGDSGCLTTRPSDRVVSNASRANNDPTSSPNDAGDSDGQGPKGDKGSAGHSGPTAPDGLTGPSGWTGMRGPSGSTGLTGDPGSRAITGAAGTSGVEGYSGFSGRPGPSGAIGATGRPGLQGETGPGGALGATGKDGPEGPKGAAGKEGPKGTKGLPGAQGLKGLKGMSGPHGLPGLSEGPIGPTGTKGDQGEKGRKGSSGNPGEPGATGAVGFPGPTGTFGQTGEKGIKGPRGSKGLLGEAGDAGQQGPGGPIGEEGVDGTTGPVGITGLPGPTGIPGPEGEPGDPADDADECSVANGRCTGLCINAAYGYYCTCPPGYASTNKSSTCPDTKTYCSETEHGRLCFCRKEEGPATPLNGTACVDIDECQSANGGCEHTCKNTPGSYECSCHAGFNIASKYLCEDIDECSQRNGNCSDVCVNTPGGYYCTCETGSHLSLDRLHVYAHEVASRTDCDNYSQTVPTGGQADGDTCLSNGQIALVAHTGGCHVTDITCRYDHLYHQSCYCVVDNGPTTYIKTLNGTTCEEANQCLTANGGCAHLCIDDTKGFHCGCQPGYTLSANGFECEDIDECSNRTLMDQHCKAPAICINTPGGYVCHDVSAMGKAALISTAVSEDGWKLQWSVIYATITTCSIISTVITGVLLTLTYIENGH